MNNKLLNKIKNYKIFKIDLQLNSESKLFIFNSKNDMEDSYENALKE